MATMELGISDERLGQLHVLSSRGRPAAGGFIGDLAFLAFPDRFIADLKTYKRNLYNIGDELGKGMDFNRWGSGLFADCFSRRIVQSYLPDLQLRLLSTYPLFGNVFTETLVKAIDSLFPNFVPATEDLLLRSPEEEAEDLELEEEITKDEKIRFNQVMDQIIGADLQHQSKYYSALSNAGDALGSVFYRPQLNTLHARSLMNYYTRLVRTFRD